MPEPVVPAGSSVPGQLAPSDQANKSSTSPPAVPPVEEQEYEQEDTKE